MKLLTRPWTRRDDGLVEERVEAERDAQLLHLLVDLGALDLGRAGVVDDLHARAFFHVINHTLRLHAVFERLVDRLNPQVVEEAGRPQPLEVVEQRPLGRLVVRHPHALGRAAERRLDVIEVGLRLDDRFVDRVEPDLGLRNDRARSGRRLTPRGGRLGGRGRGRLGRRRSLDDWRCRSLSRRILPRPGREHQDGQDGQKRRESQ